MQMGSINADLGAASPAQKHADFLGQPVVKGCWITIDEDAPIQVLDLYGEGQFIYERDGRLVTYFCCCVKKVCPPNDLAAVMAERVHADQLAGEGPRSGGGAGTSGAGAKRKEGVQPPGDVATAVEVQA